MEPSVSTVKQFPQPLLSQLLLNTFYVCRGPHAIQVQSWTCAIPSNVVLEIFVTPHYLHLHLGDSTPEHLPNSSQEPPSAVKLALRIFLSLPTYLHIYSLLKTL